MKNNSYTVNGFLTSAEAEPTQRGTLSVRKFVVKTKEEYPQTFEFELLNKSVGKVDGIAMGQEVNVSFSIRGRVWNDKVFHNLTAFGIEPLKGSLATASTPVSQPQAKPTVKESVAKPESNPAEPTAEEPVF